MPALAPCAPSARAWRATRFPRHSHWATQLLAWLLGPGPAASNVAASAPPPHRLRTASYGHPPTPQALGGDVHALTPAGFALDGVSQWAMLSQAAWGWGLNGG